MNSFAGGIIVQIETSTQFRRLKFDISCSIRHCWLDSTLISLKVGGVCFTTIRRLFVNHNTVQYVHVVHKWH